MKILLPIIFLVPLCITAQTPTNLVPPSARIPELVVWIDAEEQNGTDGDLITTVTDQAGVLSGITIEGAITLNISGSGNKEFSFLGSNNAINLGNPSQLDFLPGTDEFTIMGMLGTGVPTTGAFVSKGVNYDNFQYEIDISSNRYWTSIGNTYGYLDSSLGLVDENQHFALVVAQNEIRLYLDGQLVQTKSNSVGTGTIDVDVLIGAIRANESTNSGTSYEYAEHIRNVGIFGKALSETEIQNIYGELTNSGSGGITGDSIWTETNGVASYDGGVTVGTIALPIGYKMSVDGKLLTEEIKVQLSDNWPDYVFGENYDLPALEEVRKYIEEEGHLPNIPSAEEVKANGGVELGEMNRLLLEKIEELTMYLLELKKENQDLRNEIDQLKSLLYTNHK